MGQATGWDGWITHVEPHVWWPDSQSTEEIFNRRDIQAATVNFRPSATFLLAFDLLYLITVPKHQFNLAVRFVSTNDGTTCPNAI